MKQTIEQLQHHGERQREAAIQASDAAQELARRANSSNASVIPGPAAYDVLGDIKMLLYYVSEVTDNLPQALAGSLNDARLDVYDRDYDGNEREPRIQVQHASEQLHELTELLSQAYDRAEAAQQAISGQGYKARPQIGAGSRPLQEPLQAAFPDTANSRPTIPTSSTRIAPRPQPGSHCRTELQR